MHLFLKSALILGVSSLLTLAHPPSAEARERRTDGPKGSEWGPTEHWAAGEAQIGLHFGALLSPGSSRGNSFSLGIDADYRPDDLFGVRFAYFQGVQSPRSSLFNLTPLIHTVFYNSRPYALFGPGVGLVKVDGDLKAKFNLAAGIGADFMFTDNVGMGLEYVWNILFDSSDLHFIGARLIYSFNL